MKSRAFLLSLVAACGGGGPATVPAPLVPVTPDPPPVDPAPPAAETFPVQTAQPQALVFADEAFRAKQPVAGKLVPFALPKPKTFKLANGIEAFLLERHELPLISLELTWNGGSISDPAGKAGLAGACMDLVSEGTAALDKVAYSAALADVASTVSSYAGEDQQGVALSTLTGQWDTSFALFADTLRQPGLRADDLDRVIKRRQEQVKQSKGSVGPIAGRIQGPVYYGTGHPQGAVTTEASLGAITIADCRAYAQAWLRPKGARLFIVGDLTEAQVRAAFDGPALAGWSGAAPKMIVPPRPQPMPGRVFFVDVPGATQSQVTMLHGGPLRTAKDYFANTLMSAIVGGSFSSRLNMNLREDKGYSYGARGGFGYTRTAGVFNAGSSVRADSTYQTVLEIQREVSRLAKGEAPVTPEELAREREGAILALPSRFATGNSALAQFRSLAYFGLPLDFFNSFTTKMSKVTAKQVGASAKAHLRLDEAQYLIVGDGSAPMVVRDNKQDVPFATQDGKVLTLREALVDLIAKGTLGPGGLVVLDSDGQPVK